MRRLGFALIAFLAAAPELQLQTSLFISGEDAGYVDSAACAGCHRAAYESYRRTGMGRSFYRPTPENTVEDYQRNNTVYHQASGRYYTIYSRAGRYYQRRHQIGPDGREKNIVEKEIHYVLGSGNHSRTYLHKTEGGQLLQLPIGWYAEKGGFWAMNPGYDRPDHMDFRRKIDRECFFCHNAYPQIESKPDSDRRELTLPGAVPEGIDCQRCHGPGRRHAEQARAGEPLENVRQAILNPARLSPERQLEVCLQCHLESTSHRLPYSIRRYGRGYFSYRAGEPLSDYILHFDRSPQAGAEDKFEIAHAGYRLLNSSCFLKSAGALTCTTCHNPHGVSRGTEAYDRICRNCHEPALGRLVAGGDHTSSGRCVECHMRKRRTDDVVNVVMTDHYIARRQTSRDLLTPRREVHDSDETAYKGEVVLLYPRQPPANEETSLYLDVAQVIDGSNLTAGISRLERGIALYQPQRAEFYLELANAYTRTRQFDKAFLWYEQALRRRPESVALRLNYAAALSESGRAADVVKLLGAARQDSALLNVLGSAYLDLGRFGEAKAAFHRALAVDPELPEVYVNLGAALSRAGEHTAAIDALHNAIRLAPDFPAAHNNLATILNQAGDFKQAQQLSQEAIRLKPKDAEAHYNYGSALAGARMFEPAKHELTTALSLDPKLAEAVVTLGLVLAQQGQLDAAIEQYRLALAMKPQLMAARFNLALGLMRQRKNSEARSQFEAVLRSVPDDYEAHYHLGVILLDEGTYESAIAHLEIALKSPNPGLRSTVADAIRRAKESKGR